MPDMSREHAIETEAAAMERELVAVRRAIHRRPELAGGERETAALVARLLRQAGLDVTTDVGGHGVVGVLHGRADGPTVAYRADMDAVADDEVSDSEFRSQVPGAGHLCGHDLHTAIGVGAARVLARIRDRMRGHVAFIFQPAEETLSGAQAMIDDGMLSLAAPQEVYALHCVPLPVGTFAVIPGAGLPGQDNFDLELIGPSEVARAGQLVEAVASLSTVAPPATEDAARRHLAELQQADGPLARFVFAGARTMDGPKRRHVHIHGWVKAWPDDGYDAIRDQVRHLVQRMFGTAVRHRLAFRDVRPPAMVCDPHLSDTAAAYLQANLGNGSVTVWRAMLPFNGEDFAEFLNRVPGAMFGIGVTNTAAGFNGRIHSPDFTADERAISLGTRAMAGWLCARLDALTRA